MKKKIIAFCISDANNMPFAKKLENSLRKFHTEEELPFRIITPDKLRTTRDPDLFYRASPIFVKELIPEYDIVLKMDSDQIVTGDLSDIWTKTDYDVACVKNDPHWPIKVWDIETYYNNGLNAFRSEKFVDHWYRICHSSHFPHYQYREQDILSILTSDYFDYKVRSLDDEGKIYGEFAKPSWAQTIVKDNKLYIGEDQLCIVHFGGGADPSKGNYRIRFQPEVVNYIETLIK